MKPGELEELAKLFNNIFDPDLKKENEELKERIKELEHMKNLTDADWDLIAYQKEQIRELGNNHREEMHNLRKNLRKNLRENLIKNSGELKAQIKEIEAENKELRNRLGTTGCNLIDADLDYIAYKIKVKELKKENEAFRMENWILKNEKRLGSIVCYQKRIKELEDTIARITVAINSENKKR